MLYMFGISKVIFDPTSSVNTRCHPVDGEIFCFVIFLIFEGQFNAEKM